MLFIKMNQEFPSYGLTNIAEFHQGLDGGLFIEGVDKSWQPFTQLKKRIPQT